MNKNHKTVNEPETINATVNENGEVVEEEKKENFFKKTWNKIPKPVRTVIKVTAVAGVGIAAYVIGKGKSSNDEYYYLPDSNESDEPANSNEDEVI